ncbi:hypothetical protein OS493_013839 [Desmophyllum pertusum]|uniref:Uncharacterized protein n=1 Tax=Desmophyllum pertusum TaxID=174260 RepID=A0A9W9ZQV1_9CNID|nr:hypothetical protein OS493_013839 [Desmophyllum pertusum]
MKKLVCRCAVAASKRGFVFFGIQFWGECWSGADADQRFYMYDASNACANTEFKQCDTSSAKACAGKQYKNYVYEIVQDSPNGSGVGPPIHPEEY